MANNETQTGTVNYGAESENLGGDWLKLGVGTHQVTFLEELHTPVAKKTMINGVEKVLEQTDVLVEYQKKMYKWSVTRGISKKSVWAQLILLGKAWKTLTGKTITVLVKSDGQRKDYTIVEAVPFLGESS